MKCWWMVESIRVLLQSVHANMQLGYSLYRLSRLQGPIITVFGGKWVDSEHNYAKQAHDLAGRLVENGFSIVTGGGSGIMSAANCGAREKKEALQIKKECTLGLGVYGVDVDFINPCADVIQTSYFFMRKRLLIRYSSAIVIFPGGIGTVDELFDVLNLQKFNIIEHVPVILVGRSYWQLLVDWYNESVTRGIIRPEHKKLLKVTDNLDEIYSVICTYCAK